MKRWSRPGKVWSIILLALSCLYACRSATKKPVARTLSLYEAPLERSNANAALPGRYVGYFRLKDTPYKLPLTLDLIALKTKGEISRYQAFAKFNLEGFASREFRVEHYPQVVLNHRTLEFSAGASESQLSLHQMELKAGSIITGKIRDLGLDIGDFLVVYAGSRRALDAVSLVEKVYPKYRVFPAVAGTYRGTCENKQAVLTVANVRWDHGGASRLGFLPQYRTHATLGIQNEVVCGTEKVCTKKIYEESVVDLQRTKVTFGSGRDQLTCAVGTDALNCNRDCSFTKETKESGAHGLTQVVKRPERRDRIQLATKPLLGKQIDFEGAISGEYFGYLFNETTLRYQLYRLKVTASMEREAGMRKEVALVSGVGTMFFGEGENNEFSVNKFQGEYYSETGPRFVFAGSGDQVIQVSKWSRGGMRAILYSKSFGRVGTLELSRELVPSPPEGSDLVSQLSGTYRGASHSFTILAQPNVSEKSRNFFPLLVRGYAQEKSDTTKKLIVSGVSYDVYSGQFGLLLEDGRLIGGTETTGGFELVWPGRAATGEAMVDIKPSTFQHSQDATPGKTAVNVLDALHTDAL